MELLWKKSGSFSRGRLWKCRAEEGPCETAVPHGRIAVLRASKSHKNDPKSPTWDPAIFSTKRITTASKPSLEREKRLGKKTEEPQGVTDRYFVSSYWTFCPVLWLFGGVEFVRFLSQKSGCFCVLRLQFLRCKALSSEDLVHTRELQDLPPKLRDSKSR